MHFNLFFMTKDADGSYLNRGMDINMMAMQNAMERDAGEWAALLQEADSRFEIRAVRTAPNSMLALIEVVWKE